MYIDTNVLVFFLGFGTAAVIFGIQQVLTRRRKKTIIHRIEVWSNDPDAFVFKKKNPAG